DPAARERLTRLSAELEAETTHQFVLATVASLEGGSIDDYANRLFRHWGLGQRDVDNGVLLLVAPNERRVRIEVGYGLEGALTDALAGLIIQNTILPAFRAGNFAQGIETGAGEIVAVLRGDAEGVAARQSISRETGSSSDDWVPLVFGGAFAVFAGIFVILSILVRVFGTKVGKNRYRWHGITWYYSSGSSGGSGWSGGGFSGGGGSSGGGGASGGW
ncbi:MAG: TPM domain-containing protein, partial [Hyphomicrobiaceae bacterium]|nr:TPM domain-containing protein [Hyphomicrobiaceae bacterium]